MTCLKKTAFSVLIFFSFFWWDGDLNSGLLLLPKQMFYHLSHTSSPFSSGYFLEMGF
jgi:hypothetical protein